MNVNPDVNISRVRLHCATCLCTQSPKGKVGISLPSPVVLRPGDSCRRSNTYFRECIPYLLVYLSHPWVVTHSHARHKLIHSIVHNNFFQIGKYAPTTWLAIRRSSFRS